MDELIEDEKKEIRNFIRNHEGRNNPMYGKKHSKKTIEKIKEKRVLQKIKHSQKTKDKIGNALRRKKKTKQHIKNMIKNHADISGSNNPMYGMYGELSPNWMGGTSFEPYTLDFNNAFKESIRERDGCCMVCLRTEEELNKKLFIHHIDYNKLNSFPQNCISVCNSCHSKTNTNRVHWIKFFQSLLSKRYCYEYSEDQKIILDFTKNE